MAAERSFEAIFGWLEAQIAYDREKEAFHAQQEAFHREQKAVFTAELEKLTAILESFKTAADTAMDLASRAKARPPLAPSGDIGGRKPSLTKMVARVVEIFPAGENFGPAAVTREINRHYGERLRRPGQEQAGLHRPPAHGHRRQDPFRAAGEAAPRGAVREIEPLLPWSHATGRGPHPRVGESTPA